MTRCARAVAAVAVVVGVARAQAKPKGSIESSQQPAASGGDFDDEDRGRDSRAAAQARAAATTRAPVAQPNVSADEPRNFDSQHDDGRRKHAGDSGASDVAGNDAECRAFALAAHGTCEACGGHAAPDG